MSNQKVTAPIAAFTMALLLYTYSVTSIRAAKLNAQRHREADGGQLNMRNEMLRQRGWLERPTTDREVFVGGWKGEKIEKVDREGGGGLGGVVGGGGVGGKGDGEEKLLKAQGKRKGE